jgi:hypothetical protein
MKRQPDSTNNRLPALALALAVVLTSCQPLEQPTVHPVGIERPTLSSLNAGIVPETAPPTNHLACPSIPNTAVLLPPAPYDEEVGDCALRGRSAEIEAWLTELEQIAGDCHAMHEANWADALAARQNLDSQIDQLVIGATETPTPTPTPMPHPDTIDLPDISMEPICPSYGYSASSFPSEPYPSPGYRYTAALRTISENVGKYCTMIDELIKPLWQACDEINYYQDCQAPDPEQYHLIVERQMNTAQSDYDYADWFYNNTLQIYGWGNFRTSFNEASIDCPLAQAPVLGATFTFSKNAFCREGPSTAYKNVTAFVQQQSVQIEGRNQDEPRWWWVLIPGSSGHCWVSDSTGSATGLFEGMSIVTAPPLPPSPTPTRALACTRDLPEKRCKAAGGTWRRDPKILTAVVYFCDCTK